MGQVINTFIDSKLMCLFLDIPGGISDELKPHLQFALEKLKALEEFSINSENQYIKKITTMTGKNLLLMYLFFTIFVR